MVRKHPNQSGQIALVIILIVVVIAVVVLSVASRSVTELKLTRTEEEAAKALKIAEAGVEDALSTLSSGNIEENLGQGSYNVTAASEGDLGFTSSGPVDNGEAVEVVLTGGSGTAPTSLNIYWIDNADVNQTSTRAAIEVSVYNLVGGNYRVTHYTYDPVAARIATNKFAASGGSPGAYLGVNFGAVANVPLAAGDQLVRVRTIYNKATIGIQPAPAGSLLPDQRYRVVSVGKTEGDVTRAVEVIRNNPMLPSVFDNALYSGGGLSK